MYKSCSITPSLLRPSPTPGRKLSSALAWAVWSSLVRNAGNARPFKNSGKEVLDRLFKNSDLVERKIIRNVHHLRGAVKGFLKKTFMCNLYTSFARYLRWSAIDLLRNISFRRKHKVCLEFELNASVCEQLAFRFQIRLSTRFVGHFITRLPKSR